MRFSACCFLIAAMFTLLSGCDSKTSDSSNSSAADPAAASSNDQPSNDKASSGGEVKAGTQAGNDPAVESGTVKLEIRGSDPPVTIEIADVQTGTTLEQVMRSVTQIPISIRGSGVTAVVDAIGERASSGGEGWVFRVDGVHANQGVGSTVLTPPTTITWIYGDAGDLIGQ